MYQYSKCHRYAAVLQSILMQILTRELRGFTVEIVHVFSHLLDKKPNGEYVMNSDKRKQRLLQMQEQYGSLAMKFLQGNQCTDKQLENPPHCKNLGLPSTRELPQYLNLSSATT